MSVEIIGEPQKYETGRGYFRHPVSPLATVDEKFLLFIERPASNGVNLFNAPNRPLKNSICPFDKDRFAQVLSLFKQNFLSKHHCLKLIHLIAPCLF